MEVMGSLGQQVTGAFRMKCEGETEMGNDGT